ncbi:DUF3297 family protein [Pseudoxanthobacter sp. M-2]|uniref:DUF3297 family protein n=1 Tax=Pseudoxanthobacter sp. M-2 TaxID=3078754 RepID=UPI0038FC51D8
MTDPETPEIPGTATTGSEATAAPALPDRLSTDPASPYYDEDLLTRGVGIKFRGAEKTNVEEYCVSEGWIRVSAGTARDRKGRPLTLKLQGPVEPYLRGAE